MTDDLAPVRPPEFSAPDAHLDAAYEEQQSRDNIFYSGLLEEELDEEYSEDEDSEFDDEDYDYHGGWRY